ncbi:Hpt domain-containing protein [Paraburkholderia sp. LEh10]|nr:Hpt domain-containing protein [Paraburkholderia sp. LEh10]
MCNVFNHATSTGALQQRIDALAIGDRAVARDVTRALIETNRATLQYMWAARHAGLWGDLGRAAHRLAGSLRMLRCNREIALTLRLERAALERDARRVDGLLPIVTQAVDQLNEQLDHLLA